MSENYTDRTVSDFESIKSVDPEKLKDWAIALMQKGVIVSLNLSRWRGQTSIKQEDLGLVFSEEASEFMKKYITLGNEKLLPPEISNELSTIEKSARACLNKYSFNTVWGKFMPFISYNEWIKENNRIKELYYLAGESMERSYDSIVSVVKENYKNLAKEAWKRIYPLDKDNPSQSFIENFTLKIISRIPPANKIKESFKYQEIYSFIPFPELLTNGKAFDQEQINRIKDTAIRLELEAKAQIAKNYVEKREEIIESFLQSTVLSMRASIEEICQETINMLRDPESKLTGHSIEKLKRMIENVRVINFQDDKEISEALDNLKTEVIKSKVDIDNDRVKRLLQNIVNISRSSISPMVTISESIEVD